MYSSLRIVTLLVGCVFLVSGCGMRGPLVLPPGPAPEPLLGKSNGARHPDMLRDENTGAVNIR